MTGGVDSEGQLLAGRYRLGVRIGVGGMGAVHVATDTRLKRDVAIKVLPAKALGDQAARQRLVREALACAALQHPGIVHVYDVGETEDGGAFLVMELINGTSLRALIGDDAWTTRQRVFAIIEAARALAAAHRAGLIHRDVKPDNLMLRQDGRVVLLDFGIVKPTVGSVERNLTSSGDVVGTPSYLSPEQARNQPLDAGTDQFSLAVTAYELLSRSIPWSATSTMAVVAAILNDPPTHLRLSDAALADAIRPVIERALQKRRDDRYPDADAFADALAHAAGVPPSPKSGPAVLQHRPPDIGVPADGLASTARMDLAHAALAQTVIAPSSNVGVAPRSRRAWRLLLGGALSLAVAALALGLWRTRANPLDTAVPVLACPVLDGTIDGKPAPWLGAAAAYALADDLAPMLGGFNEHVRVPGALLARRGYSQDARELDPWAVPGLREQSLRAAASSGLPWIDGQAHAHGTVVALTVIVRSPSGRELGRASGSGTPLRAVALDVSRKLRATGALGRPHAMDPEYRAWQGVGSAEEQDAIADLELATRGRQAPVRCKVATPPRLPASWRVALQESCAGHAVDSTLPAAALARAIAQEPSVITPALRTRFDHEIASGPPGQRKALALATALSMEDPTGDDEHTGILAVVSAEPRTGWNAVREGMGTANPTVISSALMWAPDHPDWWLTATRALAPSDRAGTSEFLRREFLLFPYDVVPALYADSLLREGNAGELGVVIAYLEGSADGDARELGRLLSSRAAVLDGAFARTLARWSQELTAPGAVLGDTDDDNPRITSARELAYAIGAERSIGNAVARGIAEGTTALRIATTNVTVRANLAASCALAEASLAARCLAALAPSADAPKLQREDWRLIQQVVERYVVGDFAKAADVARGFMGSRYYAYYGVRMGDFLVDVFDRGNVPELAEAFDLPHVDDRNLHGASLATLRTARRAWTKGDKERARTLAKRVADAWRLVDMTVLAVAEMTSMLSAP